ncbi:MAG: PD-(D/E)XK nuclease family protein [bacterium]|nr:PD-(D/E)XK nuclease family protein [bacterium]
MAFVKSGPVRKSNLFNPQSTEPFKLSRTKLEDFVRCQRCFYLDRRLGIGKPSTPPFSLNAAVDFLLKKEFDAHRVAGTPHPFMSAYKIDAVPFKHKNMDVWRENFVGVQYLHPDSNFLVFGAVDDIWQNKNEELIVVDYKATAKDGEVTLDAEWQDSYKRQMEIYQWLLAHNGFTVSNTGYFVYVNGKRDAKAFDGKLEFSVKVIPYTGSGDWVGERLMEAKKCLINEDIPAANQACEYCQYRVAAQLKEQVSSDGKNQTTLF